MTSFAAAAVVFVFLGVRGLAAAQFGLIGVYTALIADASAPLRDLHGQHPNFALREPLVTLIVDVGDARKGLVYAQQNCSGCHNVLRTDAASPNPQAPAFKKVANTPGMSITALTVWSRTTHPTMPNLVIEPADMDDLIAYILSLRDR
jgi:hypothetical protein